MFEMEFYEMVSRWFSMGLLLRSELYLMSEMYLRSEK